MTYIVSRFNWTMLPQESEMLHTENFFLSLNFTSFSIKCISQALASGKLSTLTH